MNYGGCCGGCGGNAKRQSKLKDKEEPNGDTLNLGLAKVTAKFGYTNASIVYIMYLIFVESFTCQFWN